MMHDTNQTNISISFPYPCTYVLAGIAADVQSGSHWVADEEVGPCLVVVRSAPTAVQADHAVVVIVWLVA